jgi:uncharacterized protein YdeI (YjbR/CyaY-like superfamily)
VSPRFFKTPADFRKWLERNHTGARELLVGFHKKASGTPSITWPESVDQALCFGWIDGIRRRVDDDTYTIRFTPRRRGSIWSAVNIRRAGELEDLGLMTPAGRAAFAAKLEYKSGIYSYEQRPADLPEPYAGRFRKHPAAWAFYQALPPSYRKTASWWVVSAKKEETRLKRLDHLIEEASKERPFGRLAPGKKTGGRGSA